jgi:hypothetical protein
MAPGDIAQLIAPVVQSGGVMLCTYQHNKTRQITTHQVVPYAVDVGTRSKTGKVMFWCYCLDHGRIEQRNPDGVLALETLSGNFDTSAAPAWS